MTHLVAAGFNPPSMASPCQWRAVGTTNRGQYKPYLRHSITNFEHYHRRVETRRYNMGRRYATGFVANESLLFA
ncbi:hypothetical protein [Haliscomenobacter hydrossis]|uniref:hypothetical protein n=1 Tax=Haliscomenobacter hydrossis TaxID=2350 RepID=UPI0011D23811|nr:hypothetical protein [Haliscomenobacter hydrossis]